MPAHKTPGESTRQLKGWWLAQRWLLLRRLSQLSVLGLFLLGPWAGIWLLKGNLSASLLLDRVPLTDPYLVLQTLLAGHAPEALGGLGALLVALIYAVVGGRVYCSWVCPVNPITDAAGWLRERLGIKGSVHLARSTRYWLLAMTLGGAAASGILLWELVNPVAFWQRGLIFGLGSAWTVAVAIFAFDLLVMRRGWCGHLCPVGAFYAQLGRWSLLRVRADQRAACDDCMDCFAVCPEPQVIRPALKGEGQGQGPVILAPECTNCGRCIDVCGQRVFTYGLRHPNPVVIRPPASKTTRD